MGQVIVIGLIAGGIYSLYALGVVLVYRGTGALNFALGEVGALSGYASWKVSIDWGMPWIVGAMAAVVTGAAVCIAFERFVVRPMADANRLSIAVGTVGLLLFLIAFEFKVFSGSPRAIEGPISGTGPEVFGVFVSPTRLLGIAVAVAIGLGLAAFLRRTDFGLGVLAASQDPSATRLVGVPLTRVSTFVWGTAGGISAIATLFIVPDIGALAPAFASRLFVFGIAAAVVGGLNSLPGAFVGGIVVGLCEEAAKEYLRFESVNLVGIETLAVVVLILGVLLFRPQGLLSRSAVRPA